MKKLKWWQWALLAVLGIAVINSFGKPTRSPSPSPPPTSSPTPAFKDANPKFTLIAPSGIFAMIFDPGADPRLLPDLAREKCTGRSFCKVLGWTDPQFAARGFPMTDREVHEQAFDYSLNRDTGMDRALWSCKRWPRTPKNECFTPE